MNELKPASSCNEYGSHISGATEQSTRSTTSEANPTPVNKSCDANSNNGADEAPTNAGLATYQFFCRIEHRLCCSFLACCTAF